uniref:Uncharacterized protein n=1 Tax=Uncultured archaeon GZfos26G2 TaxID=3386331 RepID=Q649N3_UNCAG|nr:hypothetical protein GZ34H9_12 [uncultured archaeon GZfos34H9]
MTQLIIPKLLQKKIEEFEEDIKEVMESLGGYAKKHEYKILILLLRKGYTFVEHTGIYKKLTEEYKLKIYSDEEFKNELRIKLGSAKNVQEIKKWKMIVFDDAIDDGESIKKFFDDISEIVSENLEKAQKTLKDISKVYKNGDGTSYKSKNTSDDFIKDLVRRGNIKICAYLVNESNPEWGKKLEAKWGEKITSIIKDEDIGHKEQKEKFIKDVTRIIDFLAHTGEIIDPDHLKIEGKFKEPFSYETIWYILMDISNKISGSVYEPDIKYYHPDKKKITIYNLPCKEWISDDIRNIGIGNSNFQCKIRFIFFFKNGMIEKFQIIPIVNPKIIRGNIGSCNYSGLEKRFCELCTKNVKYENICVDCILFEVTKRVILTFIKDYFLKSEVKDKLKNSLDCKWEYLDNKYEKTKITNFVNELCKLFQE